MDTKSSCYPKCWVFDENRRRYRVDENGQSVGGPIWIEHWVEVTITSETSRSWVTNYGRKIPKAGGRGIAFSREEIEKAAFVEKSWAIAEAVRSCKDYETLRQIADIVGYSE